MSSVSKLIILSLTLIFTAEGTQAYYSADDHEASIRRNCNSLRDSEERWGCFSGDITMIEQIRRRQRAERKYVSSSSVRPSTSRVRPSRVNVARETEFESDFKPVLVTPKKKITKTPQAKQVAKPLMKDVASKPSATPQLIGKISQVPKDDGDVPVKDETAPVKTAKESFVMPGIVLDNGPISQAPSAPATLPKTEASKPVPATVINAPKSPEKKARDMVQQTSGETAAATSEAAKPAAPEAPTHPLKFAKTCASTTAEMNAKPHLKAAIARILGVESIGKGQQRNFETTGQTRQLGYCFGGPGGSMASCPMVPSQSIQMRSSSEGRLQTNVNNTWVNVSTCSDGEKIVSYYRHGEKGYNFDLASVIKRNAKGQLTSETYGTWLDERNVGEMRAGNANILMSKVIMQPEETTRFVARREARGTR